jgi:cysteinyl-tRNA synthetase
MTNSIIVEFLSPDGLVSSVKQFASIKDFIKEYPDFKYHQVREIYLHLKNKNVNKTMKKLSSIQKLIKVYDENVYKPPANNNIGIKNIDNNIKNMEHINSDDVKDVKKISSIDTISSVDDVKDVKKISSVDDLFEYISSVDEIFEYLCLHGIQINLNKSNNKLSFTKL